MFVSLFQTQILHSTGLEFHQKLEEAEDLDEIIKLHHDYTNIIFDRCLLNKKVTCSHLLMYIH